MSADPSQFDNVDPACEPSERTSGTEIKIPVMSDHQRFPARDQFGFWVRFACGIVLGLLFSAGIALRANFFDGAVPTTLVAFIAVVVVLGCGLGAAWGGDKFWYAIFGNDQ